MNPRQKYGQKQKIPDSWELEKLHSPTSERPALPENVLKAETHFLPNGHSKTIAARTRREWDNGRSVGQSDRRKNEGELDKRNERAENRNSGT